MTIEIPLTQGRVAVIDNADFGLVEGYRWHAERHRGVWYAVTKVRRDDGEWCALYMHRLILGLTDRKVYADHRDGNGLNNTRSNLRACSPAENGCNKGAHANNTSGFKGVCFHRQAKKWRAQIHLDSKQKYLGLFTSKEDAYAAYCRAAVELHGEFAHF